MDKVSWEIVDGLKSFLCLMGMINEVLVANNFNPVKTVGYEHYGYHLENQKFFLGMYYYDSHLIVFETQFVLAPDKTRKIELGEIKNGRWCHWLDMKSEEYHFLSRSKSSQVECIGQFLKESLNYVRTLK